MPRVGLVILAAGASARMGTPKQLLRFEGQTLLRRAAEFALASSCHPVIVVLGAHSARMLPETSGLPVRVVENFDWEQGMGSSLRTGVNTLLSDADKEFSGVVVMLCDQPLLTPRILDALVDAHQAEPTALIASEYAGTLGPPVLFPSALFLELQSLNGAEGAKSLLNKHRAQTRALPFPDGAFDLDTPEDYARLRAIE